MIILEKQENIDKQKNLNHPISQYSELTIATILAYNYLEICV